MGRRIAHRRYPMSYVRILGFVTLLLQACGCRRPRPWRRRRCRRIRPSSFAPQLDEEEGIELTWSIAPGYYLYRDKIVVTLDGQRVRIATEKGEPKDDPNFGMTEVYHGQHHGDRSGGTVAGDGPHHRHLSGVRREHDLLSADRKDGRSGNAADRRSAGGHCAGSIHPAARAAAANRAFQPGVAAGGYGGNRSRPCSAAAC